MKEKEEKLVDHNRICFRCYLADRWKSAVLLIFAVFTIEVFLFLYSVPVAFHLYVIGVVAVAYVIGNYLEYYAKKNYYTEVLLRLQELHEKYLIVEMLPEAVAWEEDLLELILQDADKAMSEQVNVYKRIQEEYREYIELWIHEIKLPIATAQMIIENNKDDVTKRISSQIKEIEDYTEQALFYARSNYTHKDYSVKKSSLKDMVNEVVKRNKQAFISKKIKVEFEQVDQFVYTDTKWCQFILNQILANSIKYGNAQGAVIRFAGSNHKECVVLEITDNGIGIKEGEVGRVFEKGFTGSNGRIGKKSTGIGLYLCKKLCDKLGIGIELESVKSEGTTVRLIFPKNSYMEMNEE